MRSADGLITISVSDTGIGMAPEDQVAVFEGRRPITEPLDPPLVVVAGDELGDDLTRLLQTRRAVPLGRWVQGFLRSMHVDPGAVESTLASYGGYVGI